MDRVLNSIREKLRQFLGGTSQRSLVLKGKWGVGKTHFWRDFITSYLPSVTAAQRFNIPFLKDKKEAPARSYAYVSLFGVASLNELRGRILGASGGVTGFAMNAAKVLGPLSEKGISINVPAIISGWLTEALIKDFIVCFDDLERKNPQLKLEEVLGFVDYLKNEKNCHCILIFNDDELKDEAEKLKKYREKIIDVELSFKPTLDRNFSIAFNEHAHSQERDAVLEVLTKLERTNIRTMQRVGWMLRAFSPMLESLDDNLRAQLAKQMAALAVFYYENGDVFSLDLLKNAYWLAMQESDRMDAPHRKVGESVDQKKQAFKELIYKAQFSRHDLDPVFLQYLSDGFVDEEKAKPLIDAWSKNLQRQRVQIAFQDLQEATWGGYWMNEDGFIKKVESLLNEHLGNLTFEEYDNLVAFAVKVRSTFSRTEWDNRFVAGKIDGLELDQIASYEGLNVTEDIKKKLEQRRQQLLKARPLVQVIEKLCTGDSWSPSDFRFINAYTRDELFAYFTSEANSRGASEISRLADRLRGLSNDYELAVAEKLKSILDELSKRSSLDTMRTEKAMGRIDAVLQRAKRYQADVALAANAG